MIDTLLINFWRLRWCLSSLLHQSGALDHFSFAYERLFRVRNLKRSKSDKNSLYPALFWRKLYKVSESVTRKIEIICGLKVAFLALFPASRCYFSGKLLCVKYPQSALPDINLDLKLDLLAFFMNVWLLLVCEYLWIFPFSRKIRVSAKRNTKAFGALEFEASRGQDNL